MLWLSGLIGLMAVGAFFFLDFSPEEPEDIAETPERSGAMERVMSQKLVPEDDDDIDLEEAEALDAVLKDDDGVWSDPLSEFSMEDLSDGETQVIAPEVLVEEPDDAMADVIEFDPETDSLVVTWDDAAGDPPTVELFENEDYPYLTDIFIDGELHTQVMAESGISPAHVSITPLSMAQSHGWTS